jgi:deoxyadenosine/deoxycytidine kinase
MGSPAALKTLPQTTRILVVGPCGSGKTTLTLSLRAIGIHVVQVAQEHSFVLDLWSRGVPPDVLIFLDASFETCTRRKRFRWLERDYLEQQRRLGHARAHCQLYLATDALTPTEVRNRVVEYLDRNV